MSSARITLGNFLGIEGAALAPESVPDLTNSEAYGRLQSQLASKVGPLWRLVRARLPEHVSKMLDIDGVGILVGSWNKARELRKYCDSSKYPPEDVVLVSLTKHKVSSRHQPFLELVIDGQPLGRLTFEIDLALTLDAAELTIQGGRIKKIKPGKAQGSGSIACEGAILHNVDKKLLTLPGTIDLGEGIAIPA
jgi:hypothetical protein